MSIKTLCIWIIVAGALGVGVLTIRARQMSALLATPISSSRSIGFDPSQILGLEITNQNGLQALEQDPTQPDRWLIHWAHDGLDHTWVASSTKARGALRALATARVTHSEIDLVESIGGEITLRTRDGNQLHLSFDTNSSGGFRAIRVEERDSTGLANARWFGRVDASSLDTFLTKGMLGWRTKRLFDISNSAVRSIELEAMGSKVQLAQSSTGWVINTPINIHANRTVIEDLVKVLLSLEADSFVDTPIDAQSSGMLNPIALVEIKTNQYTSKLKMGTRADVNGSSVYAQVDSATGSALITLKTEQFSKLTASAEAYISKVPTPLSPSTIAEIRINGRDSIERFSATRSVENWIIKEQQADSINRDAIDRLVGLLAVDEASFVRIYKADQVPAPFGYIELVSREGIVLDTFGIALDSTESGMRLLIMRELANAQRVLWGTDTEQAIATGAWLTAVAGKRIR